MRILTIVSIAALSAACAPKDNHRRPELKAALDRATITLRDSIPLAISQTQGGNAVDARIVLTGDDVFRVNAFESTGMKEIRIDTVSGQVVSTVSAQGAAADCSGSITLAEALAIAEADAGGEAVMVVPDDDVACAWEIQVLVGDFLWEEKIGGDGSILEKEPSDEFGGNQD